MAMLCSAPSSCARALATLPASTAAGARSGCVSFVGSMPMRHQRIFSILAKCGVNPCKASARVRSVASLGTLRYLSATSGSPALLPSASRPAVTAARMAGRSSLASARASAAVDNGVSATTARGTSSKTKKHLFMVSYSISLLLAFLAVLRKYRVHIPYNRPSLCRVVHRPGGHDAP